MSSEAIDQKELLNLPLEKVLKMDYKNNTTHGLERMSDEIEDIRPVSIIQKENDSLVVLTTGDKEGSVSFVHETGEDTIVKAIILRIETTEYACTAVKNESRGNYNVVIRKRTVNPEEDIDIRQTLNAQQLHDFNEFAHAYTKVSNHIKNLKNRLKHQSDNNTEVPEFSQN